MMWLVVGFVVFFLFKAGSNKSLVPSKIQSLAEILVDFIRGIIKDTMGEAGMKYLPLIISLFLFILFSALFHELAEGVLIEERGAFFLDFFYFRPFFLLLVLLLSFVQ